MFTGTKFAGKLRDDHRIDAKIQQFNGNCGIKWHSEDLTDEELSQYEEIIARILDRVRQRRAAGIDSVVSREVFRERAGDYLAEAEQAVRDAEVELAYRRKEVKLAARQY